MERAFVHLHSLPPSPSFLLHPPFTCSPPLHQRLHSLSPNIIATSLFARPPFKPLRLGIPLHFAFPYHPLLLLASLPLTPRCPRHSRLPLACISSAALLAGAGGSGRGFGGGAGCGGGGPGGGDGFAAHATGAQPLGAEPDDIPLSTSSDEVILLDVGGMSCGGCASSVKKILESQPHVIFASVNLATETAVIKVSLSPELFQGTDTTKKGIGEALASHLTSCGFKSSLREVPVGG